MKKNFYFSLCAVLFLGTSALAGTISDQKLSRQVNQKIEQTAQDQKQIAAFMIQLAQKDPVKLANFLLGYKSTYISDESLIYLGIKDTNEVLVVCQIDDFELGTFYYVLHKKGYRVREETPVNPPNTSDFIALFERK